MKNVLQIVFVLLLITQLQAQEKSIVTESVTIENVIPFMVENYAGTSNAHNITLLVETTKNNFTAEESILLKQAVKYLSEQLNEDDTISIVTYNALNGIVLEQVSAKNIKKLLYVINDFSSNLESKTKDGITLAYSYADEIYKENVENTVVMIRNPNGTKMSKSQNIAKTSINASVENKPKNNLVLLTAIAVLPELIAIIKD